MCHRGLLAERARDRQSRFRISISRAFESMPPTAIFASWQLRGERKNAHQISARLARRLSVVAEDECGSGSVGPSVARRAPDSVPAPILIHDHAASRIEARPVVHQAMKYGVAIRNSRPADSERIIEAGLPLFRGLGHRGGTQEGHRDGGCYPCKCFEWRQCSQVKLSRQPFVWHVHRSVRFCVSPDEHHRHSLPLPYDRRATVDKKCDAQVPESERGSFRSGQALAGLSRQP